MITEHSLNHSLNDHGAFSVASCAPPRGGADLDLDLTPNPRTATGYSTAARPHERRPLEIEKD